MVNWGSRKGWLAGSLAVLVVMVVACVLAASTVIAQNADRGRGPWAGREFGGHGFHGGPFGELAMGMRALDLTDAQRTQVRGIMQAHRTEIEAIAERMQAAHLALKTAADSGGDVQAAGSDLAKVLADGATLRAGIHKEIFAILTPEQQEKAKSLRAEHEQRMQQRMERMKQFKPRGDGQGRPGR